MPQLGRATVPSSWRLFCKISQKERCAILGVLVLLFYRTLDSSFASEWTERWGILAAVFGLAAIWRLDWRSKIFPVTLSYFLIVTVLNAYFIDWNWGLSDRLSAVMPSIEAEHSAPAILRVLRATACEQLVALGCFLGFVYLRVDLTRALRLGGWLVFAAIIVSPRTSPDMPIAPVWLIHNASMAACFTVLSLGVPWFSFIPALWARSWVAFGCFAAGTLWGMRKSPYGHALAAGGAAFLIWYVMTHGFHDSGRFSTQSQYLSFWWNQDWQAILTGLGPGSTRIWLPMVNVAHATGDSAVIFTWAHSDPIQQLIELGIVGAVALGACAVRLFQFADEKQRGLLLSLGVACSFNFIGHWVVTALIGWDLVGKISIRKTI